MIENQEDAIKTHDDLDNQSEQVSDMLQQVEEDILKAAQMPTDKVDLQSKLDALKVRSSLLMIF